MVIQKDINYKIIYGEFCSQTELYAATELQKYIFKSTKIHMVLSQDSGIVTNNEIVVGKTNRELASQFDYAQFGDDGFEIKKEENSTKVFIVGGEKRGVLYGVYSFLEKFLDYRWFTPKLETYISRESIVLPDAISILQVPQFFMRDVMWGCGFDSDWSVKQKINRGFWRKFTPNEGGGIEYAGYFCHTLGEYAETGYNAPEPCLTDEKIYNTVLKNVRARLAEKPNADMVSIAQNDDMNFCTCPKCSEIDAAEESHMGTMLRFVNRIAQDLQKDYPKLIVQTLSYQYTRKPPKITKPLKNVAIQFCTIECCFRHSLNSCNAPAPARWMKLDKESSLASDIDGWCKLTDNIHIWDYTTNFHHYFSPFPNIETLYDNVQFFARHKAKAILEQGNMTVNQTGEFAELKSYLLAKLLWSPYMTKAEFNNHKVEFMQAFYGKGYQDILDFIDILQEAVQNHMGIYYHPLKTLPSERGLMYLDKMKKCFELASSKAETDEQKFNVRCCRVQLDYYQQLATYKRDYIDGNSESKAMYVEKNRELYDFLVANKIYMNADKLPPDNVDLTRSPDMWHTFYPDQADQIG